MIEKKPFTKFNTEETKDNREIITLSYNKDERLRLESDKKILQQTKDSTCIKQLAEIGSNVIHQKKTEVLIDIVLGNKRKNKRSGRVDYE